MIQPQSAGTKRRFAVVLGVLLLMVVGLRAQSSPGVARISLMDGEVSLMRQGDTAWTSAALNTPLVSGDEIYVAGAGRAELEFDAFDVVRLSNGTDLRLEHYFGNNLHLQLRSGTMSFTTVGKEFLRTEIATPNMSVQPLHPGVLRVDVVDATHTSVTVWSGEAEVFTQQGRVEVAAGQQIQIQGKDNPEYQVVDAPDQDSWDQWVQTRESRVREALSYRYMNPDIYGGEDLDSYGQWVNVPNYGHCWRPGYVVSNWSPYYYGRWMWTPYYGWTWVSYEPWGWAPYHYGRWFHTAGWGWVWWPGAYAVTPIWAPAYVSFFVGGGRWAGSLGFGSGAVGWIPLAPYEPYYGFNRRHYINRYTSITTINKYYYGNRASRSGRLTPPIHLRNALAPGGIVAVSNHEFANGRVDQGGRILPPERLRDLRSVRGTAPVIPTVRSLQPLPGRPTLAAPERINSIPIFRRPGTVRMPAPRAVEMRQIEQSMQRARRSAGMAPLPAPAPSVRISPMPDAGRMPGRVTPTPTLPGQGRPGGIRIDPPRGAPLSLGNDGPERVITNETLRAPEERQRPPEPPRTSNWRRFGNNQPAANPPLRQPEAPMRRPEPSRTTQPRSGADRSGAPPSISPGGARPFSTPPRTSPAQRGGSISRETVPYGSRPPEVSVPPQPRSASRDSFQNHPMGIIVAPIVVRPNPATGNWGWQAGQPRSGGAATGNRPAPVSPRMEPPRPAPSMNARPGMGMPQPRSNPPAAVSRPMAPSAAPRAQAPPRMNSAPRSAPPQRGGGSRH